MIKVYNYNTDKEVILEIIKKRNIFDIISKNQISLVETIVQDVKNTGDEALRTYTKKFDSIDLTDLKVSSEEIDSAYLDVTKDDPEFIISFNKAIQNIYKFHKLSLQKSFVYSEKGIILGSIVRPVDCAGIYVPGGSAPLVSTLAMNAIPAKIAGVEKIIVATPPSKNGKINKYILASSKILEIDNIFKVGGAQAIAALAFGTNSISKTDVITGPGNIYVTIAKKIVYGIVNIDMIAGPSELVIFADDNVEDNFIAADIMSQSEHGSGLETSIAIVFSKFKADKINAKVKEFVLESPRSKEITASLTNHGMIIVVDNINDGIDMINTIAPEHLELMIENPEKILNKIKNAGAIFLGKYSPEPAGDYFAGPNHTLPTSGTARFYSPLSVNDFLKVSNYIKYDKEALLNSANHIIKIADVETLDAHARSVKERLL